jgi:N-acetylmuramoyl-L-alanine amidase
MAFICTDAGHGGDKPGAAWGNVMEKDLNLFYVKDLNTELRERGHTVFTTRESDYNVPELSVRCKLINEHHKKKNPRFDAIISIHCNVCAKKDTGTGGYIAIENVKGFYAIYSEESTKSRSLAESIANQCKTNNIVLNHGGTISTLQLGRTLAWIHNTIPTATLLELGFMTNPLELSLLQSTDYRNKMTNILADGIEKFLKN